jgi:AcrR family transcriptional regulator
MKKTPQPKTRTRRSSEQVKALVLIAARDLFAEQGFAATTTREIADRAGVAETVLFRNFGSKEQIFQAAVTEPIDRALHEYVDRWLSLPLASGDSAEMMANFVATLYDLAQDNRALLRAAPPDYLGQGAQTAFRRLEHMATENKAINGFGYDSPIAVRAAVALVITVSVFAEQLFGEEPSGNRDRVVAELTGLLTHGLMRPEIPADATSDNQRT